MAQVMEAAKDVLGLTKKVRYAIVGLGDISQRALMPAVAHTHNSEMTALVTGDPTKAVALCKKYNIKDSYSYEQFGEMLQSKKVDAIYLGTPNWRHAEFIVPALKAGIHVLAEKPMEISEEKCQEILAAQKESKAKLMVAYRLHFEPGTLSALEKVRSGDLGQVHMFTSTFSQDLKPDNHRGQNGELAGPLFDLGVYPLNACRNLFSAEPIEVSAFGTKHPGSGFSNDFCDTVSCNLRFPDNRLAQFTVSYYSNGNDQYTIAGQNGYLHMSPAFMYTSGLEYDLSVAGEKKHEKFQHTDQFGGELKYFSDCILNDHDPEPDGEEGFCDVRVVCALIRSLQTGQPQKLEPYIRNKRPIPSQVQTLHAIKLPDPSELVNATPPGK